MLIASLERLRALPRLLEIVRTLMRFGMHDLVHSVGLHRIFQGTGELMGWKAPPEIAALPVEERLRLALEALGPAFVKLGQILASRVDMLGPVWTASLDSLHDRATPVPFEQLEAQVRSALGRPVEEAFATFERDAFAAGSIAQVHRATLRDGTAVAVKIRRPGVEAVVESDLLLLEVLAEAWEDEQPLARRYQPVDLVRQLRKSLGRELDFAAEARSQERLGDSFRDSATIVIPRVHAEFTSASLLVMDWIEGVPATDIPAVTAAGLDPEMLAHNGADAMLQMILVDGLFHADPHPGNVFFLPGNRLALIDFGMIGYLSAKRRDEMVDLLGAVAMRDAQALRDVLLAWSDGGRVAGDRFTEDLGRLLHLYEHASLREISIGTLLTEIAALMREHMLVLPPDLALLFKALITLEGLGTRLVPHFRLIEQVTPYVRRLMAERWQPRSMASRFSGAAHEWGRALRSAPRALEALARRFGDDGVAMRFEIREIEEFGRKLQTTLDRLTIGLVTAALIVGSSIIMAASTAEQAFWPWMMGCVGVVVSFLNSLWLLAAIRRSRK